MPIYMNEPKPKDKEAVKKILNTSPEQAKQEEALDIMRYILSNSNALFAALETEIKEEHKNCILCVNNQRATEIREIVDVFARKNCNVDIKPLETEESLDIKMKIFFSEAVKFSGDETELFSKLFVSPFYNLVMTQNTREKKTLITFIVREVGTYKKRDGGGL